MTAGASSTEVSIGGVRVQVDSEGDGVPIVLVHSLLTGPEAFEGVVRALATRHLVHRVSLPGFGRSQPLPRADPTIDDLADHLAAVLSVLDGGPDTVVLGNGLGGFVSAAMAIRHGAGFGRLILSNCGAAFSEERTAAFAVMSRLVGEGGMHAVADVAVRRIFPEAYLEAHPDVIGERRAVLAEIDASAFAAACRALAVTDLRPALRSIGNETLVVVGEEDATTPPEMGYELAAGIEGATVAVIPGCGHCPQLQAPAALLAAVEGFIDPEVGG